jgi:hypothetical protein
MPKKYGLVDSYLANILRFVYDELFSSTICICCSNECQHLKGFALLEHPTACTTQQKIVSSKYSNLYILKHPCTYRSSSEFGRLSYLLWQLSLEYDMHILSEKCTINYRLSVLVSCHIFISHCVMLSYYIVSCLDHVPLCALSCRFFFRK